jgi:hypothetical protein
MQMKNWGKSRHSRTLSEGTSERLNYAQRGVPLPNYKLGEAIDDPLFSGNRQIELFGEDGEQN